MRRNQVSFLFTMLVLLGFATLLLLYPQESAAAARDGLTICFTLIIPSLFPFFVLSSLLVSLGFATLLGKCMKGFMWPLFRLNPSCASALVLGAVGGYPVGARITAQLYETKQCSKADALRLTAFCNNCGPAFLFSVAGWGIFSSKAVGFLLLGTHLLSALIVGLLFRFYPVSKDERMSPLLQLETNRFSAIFPDSVKDSFSSTLNVCAFVILFSVILRLASCSGFLPHASAFLSSLLPTLFSPEVCQSLLAGIFELSYGVYSISNFSSSPIALPLAAFIMGWGGLSVHCQSLPFLKRCTNSLRPYLIGKFLQGMFAAIFTSVLAPVIIPYSAPTFFPMDPIISPPLAFSLLHQEILALWVLSGLYFLFSSKKCLVKPL